MTLKNTAGSRLASKWKREQEMIADYAGQDVYIAEDWQGNTCVIGEGCDYESFQDFVIDQLYTAMKTNTIKEFMEKASYKDNPKELLSDMLCEDDDDGWYQDEADVISGSRVEYMGDSRI